MKIFSILLTKTNKKNIIIMSY